MDVSLARLYLLRAMYVLLIVGLGATTLPEIISHDPMARGVIPSLLGAIWLLAWLGVRYPLPMLPLLLFECAWKTTWLLGYGLPQRLSGHTPPTFAVDFPAIIAGVILTPLVIPWGYVYHHYVKAEGSRWRQGAAIAPDEPAL